MAAKPFPQCLLLLLLLWFLSPLPVLFFLFHSLDLVFVVGLFYSPTYIHSFIHLKCSHNNKPNQNVCLQCNTTPHHHPLLIWPAMFLHFWPYKLHVCLGEYSFQCLFSFLDFALPHEMKAATDTKKKIPSKETKPKWQSSRVLVGIMDKLFCHCCCCCNHNLLSSTHTFMYGGQFFVAVVHFCILFLNIF